MLQGKGAEIMTGLLNDMEEYAKYHFHTEEVYFDKFKYEHTDEHVAYHHVFTNKVDEFRSELAKENLAISIMVMEFLRDWLTCHIKISDKQYTKCFQENGLK